MMKCTCDVLLWYGHCVGQGSTHGSIKRFIPQNCSLFIVTYLLTQQIVNEVIIHGQRAITVDLE